MQLPKITPVLVAAVAAFIVSVARADTFKFSYEFTGGPSITGTFTGTQNGPYVGNVANFDVYIDGLATPARNLDPTVTFAIGNVAGWGATPLFSSDAALNDFHLSDVDLSKFPSSETWSFSLGVYGATFFNYGWGVYDFGDGTTGYLPFEHLSEAFDASHWSLELVGADSAQSVPDNSPAGLLLLSSLLALVLLVPQILCAGVVNAHLVTSPRLSNGPNCQPRAPRQKASENA